MIPEKIEGKLNEQIAMEFNASNFYLAIASWCDTQGYEGTAHFFVQQSNEERDHGMRIFHFINSLDGHAVAPEISKPPVSFNSYREIFERSLEQEKRNTKAIHEIVDMTLSEKDYSTYNFMHWYLDEQVEEENLFRSILDKLDIVGEEGSGLYMLDNELGQRQDYSSAQEE